MEPGSSHAVLDVQRLSTTGKLQYLRDKVVTRPTRSAADVLLCAAHVLCHGGISEAERASITEQAVIAAFDCGDDAKANELLRKLTRQFGRTSVRVRRLHGLALEAANRSQAAMEIYAAILKERPTDQFCVRRLAALYRSEGNYGSAIEVLKTRPVYHDEKEGVEFTYAQMYPNDEAAARELVALYWLQRNVSECIRFSDELVLFDPANYLHYNRLAEFCAVDGQIARSATAYAQSLRLNSAKNNARALYGLWYVAKRLVQTSKPHTTKANQQTPVAQQDAAGLLEFAETRLRNTYAASRATASFLELTLQSTE